mgnify:CR=1 FL=1
MKTLFILVVSVLLIGSCGVRKENKALKAQLDSLKTENVKLKKEQSRRLATLTDYRRFLNEVEANLSEIDKNRELVANLNKEVNTRKELAENIRAHISNISALMENSRLKIMSMDRSLVELRKDTVQNSEEILMMENRMDSLTRQLVEMDRQIEILDNSLEEIDSLYRMEKSMADQLDDIINRAYFYAGPGSELRKRGIVEKEGGFIGLGRVKVLDASAPDSLFIKIRKDEDFTIPFDGRDAKLITQHPEDSYSVTPGNLRINDPDEFWKAGNYLVIESKN